MWNEVRAGNHVSSYEKRVLQIIQQGDLKNGDLTVMGFKSNALESELGSVGILGVECIYTFVNDPQKPRDFFPKLILEQNSRTDGKRCPIGLASIEITKALMEHFQVVNDQCTQPKQSIKSV